MPKKFIIHLRDTVGDIFSATKVTITKEQAKELLEDYDGLRPAEHEIDDFNTAVEIWASIINNGQFYNHFIKLVISERTGKLLNGLHRLNGFIKSNAEELDFWVCTCKLNKKDERRYLHLLG